MEYKSLCKTTSLLPRLQQPVVTSWTCHCSAYVSKDLWTGCRFSILGWGTPKTFTTKASKIGGKSWRCKSWRRRRVSNVPNGREFCQPRGWEGWASSFLPSTTRILRRNFWLMMRSESNSSGMPCLKKSQFATYILGKFQRSQVCILGRAPNPRIHKNIVSKNQEYPDSWRDGLGQTVVSKYSSPKPTNHASIILGG